MILTILTIFTYTRTLPFVTFSNLCFKAEECNGVALTGFGGVNGKERMGRNRTCMLRSSEDEDGNKIYKLQSSLMSFRKLALT